MVIGATSSYQSLSLSFPPRIPRAQMEDQPNGSMLFISLCEHGIRSAAANGMEENYQILVAICVSPSLDW